MNLNNFKFQDVYRFESDILKLPADYILEVLAYLFISCVDECSISDLLKYIKAIPIYMKSSKSDYNNYRPVSII